MSRGLMIRCSYLALGRTRITQIPPSIDVLSPRLMCVTTSPGLQLDVSDLQDRAHNLGKDSSKRNSTELLVPAG